MAYGSNYGGNRGGYGNNGGYQRNNYGGGQQGGGYQQPAPQPIDIHAEIKARFDLYNEFKNVALNELGITQDEFYLMAPMLGGWVTSVLLKQEKGK